MLMTTCEKWSGDGIDVDVDMADSISVISDTTVLDFERIVLAMSSVIDWDKAYASALLTVIFCVPLIVLTMSDVCSEILSDFCVMALTTREVASVLSHGHIGVATLSSFTKSASMLVFSDAFSSVVPAISETNDTVWSMSTSDNMHREVKKLHMDRLGA